MLVTVLAILVTNFHYLFTLASGTNIQKMSPTSKFSHQNPKIVASFKSPTLRCHQHQFHRYYRFSSRRLILPDFYVALHVLQMSKIPHETWSNIRIECLYLFLERKKGRFVLRLLTVANSVGNIQWFGHYKK